MLKDTIAAIATPTGTGGIGIVRISGSQAETILHRLFKSSHNAFLFKPRRLYHGDIIVPETGQVIDEVLISLMPHPHSYTGEDTLEIFCHGGILIVEAVLQAVLRNGARLAEPGEFTRRAFLNDRIDLTQAEAIGELIRSDSPQGLKSALAQLKGQLRKKIDELHDALMNILVLMESSIEFSEDMDSTYNIDVLTALQKVSETLAGLIKTYNQGKIYRHGASVVIAGRPNTGKSSLLNCLLQEKRAIVTSIPGTTRDFIEEALNIHGITVKITDTAGIHHTEDLIELEGIRLVWEKLETADIVILLLDGSRSLTDEDRDIFKQLQAFKILPVINKSDLDRQLNEEEISEFFPNASPLWISAKFGKGMSELKDKIYSLIINMAGKSDEDVIISNLRHKIALDRTADFVFQALTGLNNGLSQEFVALDIREALDALGEITGETVTEDILDRIFSSFCIGK
jgi:tRNA modification GTPase